MSARRLGRAGDAASGARAAARRTGPAAALVMAVALAICGAARAQPGIGRLFNTPAERAALDINRGKASVNGAQAAAADTGLPAALPGPYSGPSGPSGAAAAAPVPDLPNNLPPELRQALLQSASMPVGMDPAAPPGMPPVMPPAMPAATPGMPGGVGTASAAPEPAARLEMNGLVRSSSGRSTVWLNNVPQSGAHNKFSNRNNKALSVTLPSGKKILLQPGQRYDLADGRVKDVNEP
nr:hypothetical protein [uncultured Duganella sp.]